MNRRDRRDRRVRKSAGAAARVACLALVGALIGGCSIPRWPVAGELSSPYGLRFRGWSPDWHNGVDVRAPAGTPVHAMKSGRVSHAGTLGGYGLTVILDHGPNLRTLYAHLSGIDVRAGERVDGRQQIGRVGATGNATGPHLHFEILRWGTADDPVRLLGGEPPRR